MGGTVGVPTPVLAVEALLMALLVVAVDPGFPSMEQPANDTATIINMTKIISRRISAYYFGDKK